ncbi:MAG: SDR family NAD(P)-dependent oxidoreductase [Streptosporangiaceae bacterium]
MWAELSALAADERLTILLPTHYLEEADRLADRLAIVDRGRVVAEGTPDQLKSKFIGLHEGGDVTEDPTNGPVSVVTGASSGIGRATARGLASRGGQVLLVCRDQNRGESAADEIRRTTGNERVDVEVADLAAQASVRALADHLSARLDRLDVLVNNAGMVFGRREVGPDGIERTFALNHLGYFLLTRLLLDLLRRSAPARVVNVTSKTHMAGRIDFDDLGGETRYDGMRAYNQSKLANVLFTVELARRLEGSGVTVNCVHPGVVASGFGRDAAGLMRFGLRLARPFLRSPERGADTVVWLATAPAVEHTTGGYFVDRAERKPSPASRDETTARRLWEVSEGLTGLGRREPGRTE